MDLFILANMQQFSQNIIAFSNFIWGTPILVVLLGGGLFFLFYSRFVPFKYLRHALYILRGKYDDPNEPGQINHYQALSTALAATVGMGNISGVAVAITMGGPGAIFWMWVSAFFGVATKYFTCTLAVMFRGKDSNGDIQGGPMYYITNGLGEKWKPLAVFFSITCALAVVPIFQANQLTQVIRDMVLIPNGVAASTGTDLLTGTIIGLLMALVIFGGIKRIGKVTGQLVPFMVLTYFLVVAYILIANYTHILPSLALIFKDAFTGDAVLGGSLGAIIIAGVRRAAFSNEAGVGTAPLAHGAAKTNEPVREGLVAMLGPIIDTIIVCTLTALAILVTGVWEVSSSDGITLTAEAFNQAIPGIGAYILIICVTFFALSTLFAYPYYGGKCIAFLTKAHHAKYYYIFSIVLSALAAILSMDLVVGLIDSAYALMAFPNMLAALLLAPKVRKETIRYFNALKAKKELAN